jgi:hypothetical protein
MVRMPKHYDSLELKQATCAHDTENLNAGGEILIESLKALLNLEIH